MGEAKAPELLLLHALPLDGSMWAGQMGLLPGASHAPTLYNLGDSVEDWAAAALRQVEGERLIVVGCSVGGSCAIEVARAAPKRIAALVLIGTKARHRPDPELHRAALRLLREEGMAETWRRHWAPLFSASAAPAVVAAAREIALAQAPDAVARGLTAFHGRPDRRDFLPACARPVIIVTGAEDVAPGPRISAEQAAAAPRGCLQVIEGSGHYVPLERSDALNAILRNVIAEHASC